MIIEEKNTVLAYRCPKCGGGVLSVVGLFRLSADMLKLKCDCAGSEMTVVKTSDGKVRLTVPCMLCPNPHHFTLGSNTFFNKDLFTLSCTHSGISLAMMGEENRVKAELARSELQLLDLMEKNGIIKLDELRGQSDFADPQVIEIIMYVIKELDEENKIYCKCDEGVEREFELDFEDESVNIRCKCCGASKSLAANSLISAHEFLNADSLELQ